MANPLKTEVIRLYKNVSKLVLRETTLGGVQCCRALKMCLSSPNKLLYLGREYPQGAAYFKQRLKSAFMKHKDVTDPEKIKQLVARGDHVIKELEALYFLRKYRAMKKRYYEPEK